MLSASQSVCVRIVTCARSCTVRGRQAAAALAAAAGGGLASAGAQSFYWHPCSLVKYTTSAAGRRSHSDALPLLIMSVRPPCMRSAMAPVSPVRLRERWGKGRAQAQASESECSERHLASSKLHAAPADATYVFPIPMKPL